MKTQNISTAAAPLPAMRLSPRPGEDFISYATLAQRYRALQLRQRHAESDVQRLRELLSQQVSSAVACCLLDQAEEPAVREYEATVMFMDIRNFTDYAEATSAREVAHFQNRLFGILMAIVERHGGMVNQLLGDGLMAVFGAPARCPHHAARAVCAGREMLQRVRELAEAGEIHPLRIGIGLHTGTVLAGNLGNTHRKQYSFSGSTVIVAARIEPLNKDYGSQLLISRRVVERAGLDAASLIQLGPIRLKGFRRTVELYRVA